MTVEKLLDEKGIRYRSTGRDILIKCLNPEHDDDNPSLRIDREDGLFHCLSCGYKGNVYSYFNKHRNKFNAKVNSLKDKINEIRRASWLGYDIPQDAFFVSRPFKNIPKEILEQFQAFSTTKMGMEDRVVFPIRDARDRIVGFQGRYENTSVSPKYLAYPAKFALPWFPNVSRMTPINNKIVLCEGLPDALFLQGKGITCAITIFGTKSVNMDNILDHLTQYILGGVQEVVLLLDGDAAGRRATEHITNCITTKTDLLVHDFGLPNDVDPATMSDYLIEKLKNYLTEA